MTEAQEWMHLNSTHSSTELIDCMGSDKTVVHSARVSYANDDPLNSMLNDKDEHPKQEKHMSQFVRITNIYDKYRSQSIEKSLPELYNHVKKYF